MDPTGRDSSYSQCNMICLFHTQLRKNKRKSWAFLFRASGASRRAAHVFPESWAFYFISTSCPLAAVLMCPRRLCAYPSSLGGMLKTRYEIHCCWNTEMEKKIWIGLEEVRFWARALGSWTRGYLCTQWTLINACGWWIALDQLLRVVTSRSHCLLFEWKEEI